MKNGFTLIEFMIIVAILGILAVAAFSGDLRESNLSYGVNGLTETRCINGFSFVVGKNGSIQQLLNENGGGVRC